MPRRIPHRFPRVAAHVRDLVGRHPSTAESRELLLRIMALPGRVLCPRGVTKWPGFVREVSLALGLTGDAWVVAAAAVEFAVAAIDVTDDLIDGEWDTGLSTPERATNAALCLGWLAQIAANDLAPLVGSDRAVRVATILSTGSLRCCVGQDLDLLLERLPGVTEERSLEMTELKSGSLVAMACEVGAALATEDQEVLREVGVLGARAGVIAQLLNDIADVNPENPRRKSDVLRGKRTLPIAFALRCAREEPVPAALAGLEAAGAPVAEDEARVVEAIRDVGGLHYAWAVAEVQRDAALETIAGLARRTGREEVTHLLCLLPPLDGRVAPAKSERGR